MTYDSWKAREPELWFEPMPDEIPEPSEEQMLLDMLWDRINSLGGIDDCSSPKAYDAGRVAGWNAALDATLAILEKAGARPSNERLEPSR